MPPHIVFRCHIVEKIPSCSSQDEIESDLLPNHLQLKIDYGINIHHQVAHQMSLAED